MGMTVTETQGTSSIMPAHMERLTPPQGTKLYEVSRSIYSFGVQQIAHGRIRTFCESPLEPAEYVEGTFIVYQPGTLYAHVTRRGLSADEINRIGDICAEVDTVSFKLTFLPKTIEQTTKLINDLRILGISRKTSVHTAEVSNAETLETISTLGVLLDRLEQQRKAISEDYDGLLRQADQLGVAMIQSHTGSNERHERSSISVKLYLSDKDKSQSEETTNP